MVVPPNIQKILGNCKKNATYKQLCFVSIIIVISSYKQDGNMHMETAKPQGVLLGTSNESEQDFALNLLSF